MAALSLGRHARFLGTQWVRSSYPQQTSPSCPVSRRGASLNILVSRQDLSTGSEWFIAALLALSVSARIEPPWISKDKNVVGTAMEATFVLHNPFKDEKKEIKVAVKDVNGGNEGNRPW